MFRIENIPSGEFELIFSHVGYWRQIVSLNVLKSESLCYEIKPQPKLVTRPHFTNQTEFE